MKVRAALASLAAGAALISVAAPQADAVTYGLRWPTRTVYVYVDATVSSRWYVTKDLAQWSRAGGINVYRTSDPAKAQIRVHQRDLPSPNAAQTALAWSGSTLVGADITLDSTMVSSTYCSRRHTATHELGHALGLDHNTTSKTSIMFVGAGAVCSYVPNSYDYADVRAIYPF